MNITQVDTQKFSDISVDNTVDLSEYVVSSGVTEDGLHFAEFCIPLDVLPIDQINTEAFDRYLGSIKLEPPVIQKDSTGIFDVEKPAEFYFLTLFEQ